MPTLNLGKIYISDELLARCKKHGYSKKDIIQVIVGNGEEALNDALDMSMVCEKCGCSGSQGTANESCDHEWLQK